LETARTAEWRRLALHSKFWGRKIEGARAQNRAAAVVVVAAAATK
jgi:hypothetical protein